MGRFSIPANYNYVYGLLFRYLSICILGLGVLGVCAELPMLCFSSCSQSRRAQQLATYIDVISTCIQGLNGAQQQCMLPSSNSRARTARCSTKHVQANCHSTTSSQHQATCCKHPASVSHSQNCSNSTWPRHSL